jgi:hypothetical protein
MRDVETRLFRYFVAVAEDILALLDANLQHAPLAGFVVEGLSPYCNPMAAIKFFCGLRVAACPSCASGAETTRALRLRLICSSVAVILPRRRHVCC